MATVEESAAEYFATLNPLARKIHQDQENLKKSYGGGWENFNLHEQEELIDKYIIDPTIKEKYEVNEDEQPEQIDCFPKLNIQCGEKIVVDFENNDGWTWRDEHSAPFCWETRSQLDMSLTDGEDEGTEVDIKEKEHKEPKRPKRNKRSRSPDPNLAYKPERSIWESPFLAADRGLDSGYPSSSSSDHSKGSEETEELLHKFGLNLSLSADKEEEDEIIRVGPVSPNEQTQLIVISGTCGSSKPVTTEQQAISNGSVEHKSEASSQPTSSDSMLSLTKSGKKKPSSTGDKKRKSSRKDKRPEPEHALITPPISAKSPHRREQQSGQVSAVFVEDRGESSDFDVYNQSIQSSTTPSLFTSMTSESVATEPPVLSMDRGSDNRHSRGQVNPIMGDTRQASDFLEGWSPDILNRNASEKSPDDQQPKTGFDFLDDW